MSIQDLTELHYVDFHGNYVPDEKALNIYDEEGYMIASIPLEECPTQSVFAALCKMYTKGYITGKACGHAAAQREIRKALGL